MRKLALTLFYAISTFTPDEYHLARAIAGERPELISMELAEPVGQVALNRLKEGWCPTLHVCVDTGFWGALTVEGIPPTWALQAARNVLQRDEHRDDYFVFSRIDCKRLGLRLEDANHYRCSGEWCLAFFGKATVWN